MQKSVGHWWVDGRGHNDVTEGKMVEYISKVSTFIDYAKRKSEESGQSAGPAPEVMEREGSTGGASIAPDENDAGLTPKDVDVVTPKNINAKGGF